MTDNYVASSVVLAESVRIGRGAVIEDGCVIGDGAIIRDCVKLYAGTKVGAGTEIFDGAVIGRQPKGAGNMVHNPSDDCPPVVVGADSVIGANAVIYAGVTIGQNAMVCDLATVREGCVIGDYVVIARLVSLNRDVKIGAGSKVMDNSHLTADFEIGEDCFLGVGIVSVNDNDMRMSGGEVKDDTSGRNGNPVVGNGVKIGSGAIILPAVRIGDNAFVGAGSIVTRDVAPGAFVIGSPARER
jgi:acetyltransferase-like isoleucine patch superfamily enzyme